ncbi:hypothetical protein ACHAXT_008580 [Thalassiosira profunda]
MASDQLMQRVAALDRIEGSHREETMAAADDLARVQSNAALVAGRGADNNGATAADYDRIMNVPPLDAIAIPEAEIEAEIPITYSFRTESPASTTATEGPASATTESPKGTPPRSPRRSPRRNDGAFSAETLADHPPVTPTRTRSQRLLKALRPPVTPERRRSGKADSIEKARLQHTPPPATPDQSRPKQTTPPRPSPTHVEKVGELPRRSETPLPPPPPPPREDSDLSTLTHTRASPTRLISDLRQLSKAERRRLLEEVKVVLGGDESLASGTNDRSGTLEASRSESQSVEGDTAFYTEYTEGDTAFYTEFTEGDAASVEGDTAFYTEYTEGDTAFYTEYTEGDTAFYTECTEGDATAFRTEGTEAGRETHDDARDERRRRRRARRRRRRSYDEGEDEGFFGACLCELTHLCGGGSTDEGPNTEDDLLEKVEWNGGGADRTATQGQKEADSLDEVLNEKADDEVAKVTAPPSPACPTTVKERLAQLEEELIGGKGRSRAEIAADLEEVKSLVEEVEVQPDALEDSRAQSDSPPIPDAADGSQFWTGDGVWKSDPSVFAQSEIAPATANEAQKDDARALALVIVASADESGAEVPLVEAPVESSPVEEVAAAISADGEGELPAEVAEDNPAKEDEGELSNPGSFTPVRSRNSPLAFVRALSSSSRKNSKSSAKLLEGESEGSVKSNPSVGTKSTEAEGSTRTDPTNSPTRRDSGITAGSSASKKVVWKEYVDPTTGNNYYSNGTTSTWERPPNVEIKKARPASRIGTPTISPATPVAGNSSKSLSTSAADAPRMNKTPPPSPSKKESKKKAVRFKLFRRGKKNSKDATKGKGAGPVSPDRTVASIDDKGSPSPVTRFQTPLTEAIADDGKNVSPVKKSKRRKWRQYSDPNTGKKYYSDGATTTWDRPAGFVVGEQSAEIAAIAEAASKSILRKEKWREYKDPTSGKTYYSNGKMTTWDRPDSFSCEVEGSVRN